MAKVRTEGSTSVIAGRQGNGHSATATSIVNQAMRAPQSRPLHPPGRGGGGYSPEYHSSLEYTVVGENIPFIN